MELEKLVLLGWLVVGVVYEFNMLLGNVLMVVLVLDDCYK